ncbi:MAG: hypothetical protein ACK4MF_01715 [Hyphomicrobiaceae bacterium]
MTTLRSNTVVAALAAACVPALAAPGWAGESNLHRMVANKGISFDVGKRRAVSYYLADGGICKLTVLIADSAELDAVKGAATRITIPVVPKQIARIDTTEGKTLAFICAPSARSMTVTVLEQLAVATPVK